MSEKPALGGLEAENDAKDIIHSRQSFQSFHFENHEDGALGDPEFLPAAVASLFGFFVRRPRQGSPRMAWVSVPLKDPGLALGFWRVGNYTFGRGCREGRSSTRGQGIQG